jgi:hypothetical protein
LDILGLTTTEAIRAMIGIDEASRELPDQLFIDLEIEDALRLEFGSWLPVTLDAWCALEVLQAADISLAQRHSDGQNEFARQTYKVEDLLNRLNASYLRYRDLVLSNLGETVTASTTWLAGVATPTYDPVTNTTTTT